MTKHGIVRTMLAGVLLASVVLTTGSVSVAESAEVTKKLKRQMGVLERVIDEVLVESPNFLVGSQQNTHGLYLGGFGALFSFEASLISNDGDWDWGDFQKKFNIRRENGQIIIDVGDDDDDDDDEDFSFNEEKWRTEHEEEQAELYQAGKTELTEALMDYGETLTSLDDTEWVAVAAFLRDSDFFVSSKISTLVLKAKIGDLRSYARGNISEKQMAGKVVEEEY